ncbi:hypothetical protein NWT09_05265 [Mycolicibacterium sp. jd]|uniref:hypothetical protein n=1 Tax=unclassified Mycolicibacterium TaxID=2636767 RepID=UPI00351ACD3F
MTRHLLPGVHAERAVPSLRLEDAAAHVRPGSPRVGLLPAIRFDTEVTGLTFPDG